MDKSIPQSAATLLNFIGGPESRGNYEAISSFKQAKLPNKLTKMTVDGILREGVGWIKKYGTLSSAAGKYQIINKTLRRLKEVMGLTGKEKFTPDLQDRMAYQLLRYRGYDQFMAGQISVKQFGKNLAMEWASLPVLSGTKNYKGVNIKRGTSYYAGDGLNSHGVTADAFEDVLEKALAQPTGTPKTGPSKTDIVVGVGTAGGAGGAIAVGAGEAVKDIDKYGPVLDLVGSIAKFGPYVVGAIVIIVVSAVIIKKVWK